MGGGSAGMSVAAQLLSTSTAATPSDITVFDAARTHFYQPAFTMVAGGVFGDDDRAIRHKLGGVVQKPMKSVFDGDIRFVADSIGEYNPDSNALYTLGSHRRFTYDVLVVCSGIECRFDLIEGAEEALHDRSAPVGSMYDIGFALKMNKMRSKFKVSFHTHIIINRLLQLSTSVRAAE